MKEGFPRNGFSFDQYSVLKAGENCAGKNSSVQYSAGHGATGSCSHDGHHLPGWSNSRSRCKQGSSLDLNLTRAAEAWLQREDLGGLLVQSKALFCAWQLGMALNHIYGT